MIAKQIRFSFLPMFYSAAFATANHTHDNDHGDSIIDDGDVVAFLILFAGLCIIYSTTKTALRCVASIFGSPTCCRDNDDRAYVLPEQATLTV